MIEPHAWHPSASIRAAPRWSASRPCSWSAASAAGRSTTELAGAVIAPGQLVVDSNVKKVQHPTGGVVGELASRDGDRSRPATSWCALDETHDPRQPRHRRQGARRAGGAPGARSRPSATARDDDRLSRRAARARRASRTLARSIAGEQRLFELRRTRARRPEGAAPRAHRASCRSEIAGLDDADRRPRRRRSS